MPTLIPLLDDRLWSVRMRAAIALGNIADPTAVPHLRGSLEDPVLAVRIWSAMGLGKIGDRTAVPRLIELLSDPEWRMRRIAAEALADIGDPRALEPLRRARARERLLRRRFLWRASRKLLRSVRKAGKAR